MLKGLKKDGKDKKETKKQANKQKATKTETKKQKEQQEEDASTDLVDINYNEKETTVKTVKKVQGSKLEEKEIDTSNIVIEKKEEPKVVKKWGVDQAELKNLLKKDWNAAEHQTDFVSLTDDTINKQLEEKAKKEAEENKPKVVEMGGLKFAPLANTEKGREQELVFNKKVETGPVIGNIPVKEIVFVNGNQGGNLNFAPLEKTAQQLKEEELENRIKNQPELATKGKGSGWLGTKQPEVKPSPPADFKVSAWALKAQEATNQTNTNFAPLQKTTQQLKIEGSSRRQEQEFKFTSKKQQEQRRKARELLEAQTAQTAQKK